MRRSGYRIDIRTMAEHAPIVRIKSRPQPETQTLPGFLAAYEERSSAAYASARYPWIDSGHVLGGQVSRRIVGVTLDNLDHLSRHSRGCVFWELAPHLKEQSEEFGQTEFDKEAWISAVLLEWGSCGRIVYVDGVPAGHVLYAPPSVVPRAASFPTAPASADAVLITALQVLPEFAGGGLGRMLVQAVAKDLTRRGVKAIEAFGDAKPEVPNCVLPADFLLRVGFKTVSAHPKWPRMRLELRSALTWKEDVEAALEQLLGSVSIAATGVAEPSLRPA